MSTVRGFVALTSVLVVALITAMHAIAGSETAILVLYDLERLMDRSQAKADANTCLTAAMMYGVQEHSLSEPHTLWLSDSTACSIEHIELSNDTIEVRVHGGRENASAEFKRTVPKELN